MSAEPTGANRIRTSWPELTADVSNVRRLAQRVATRAGDDENHRLLVLSKTIEGLTARISNHETSVEQREIETRAREARLDERITTESEEWRRSRRSIEDLVAQLQHEQAASDERTEILEREMLRIRRENTELIRVLEGLFTTLASRTDVVSLQQELEESERDNTRSFQVLTDEISGVRSDVHEHSATLEMRYVELRDRVEEARVTAEKASDRADFASDGVSAVQVDLEEELAALNERLLNTPSESELRAEFAAVARKEVRTQAEQLSAIRVELDRRLEGGRHETFPLARTARRWQQWIDLDEVNST